MTDAALAALIEPLVRQAVRAELRACGIRPPAPAGPGAWSWDAAADAWVAVPPFLPSPETPQRAVAV
jgi:hypothetical protein